jgi:hypothetical protein
MSAACGVWPEGCAIDAISCDRSIRGRRGRGGVKHAADLVQEMRALQSLDEGQPPEDGFVEQALAAVGAALLGDEADGGVVM